MTAITDLCELCIISSIFMSQANVSGMVRGVGEKSQQSLCGARDRVETPALQLPKESGPKGLLLSPNILQGNSIASCSGFSTGG